MLKCSSHFLLHNYRQGNSFPGNGNSKEDIQLNELSLGIAFQAIALRWSPSSCFIVRFSFRCALLISVI